MGGEKTRITHIVWFPGNQTTPNPGFSPSRAYCNDGSTGTWGRRGNKREVELPDLTPMQLSF